MDIATIVGLVALITTFMALVGPLARGYLSAEGSIAVLGGATGATLMGHNLQEVVRAVAAVRLTVLQPAELTRLALLQVPGARDQYRDLSEPLLDAQGRRALESDLENGAAVLRSFARYALASGAIGALVLVIRLALADGLSPVLQASAPLLPLLYGAAMCELICRPLANKLDRTRVALARLQSDQPG